MMCQRSALLFAPLVALWFVFSVPFSACASEDESVSQSASSLAIVEVSVLVPLDSEKAREETSKDAVLLVAQADSKKENEKAAPANPADQAIGSIKSASGNVSIVRGEELIAATPGARLRQQDIIKTEKDGSVGLILKDDTVLSLGPSSELKLKEFKFEPKDEGYSFVAKMLKGTFVYVSGLIGKLSPDSVQLQTPVGIIAVRGTKLLVRIKG